MQNEHFIVRSMMPEEVELAVEWAAGEGWDPGLHDAACYYAADPHGFLVGLLDDVPIATLSAVRYGDSFGFLGFYIVRPEYRGQGYGIQIWHAGLEHLEGVNVGLDGVVAQQANYQKSGFSLAYRNVRYCGAGGGPPQADSAVVELSVVPFEEVVAYDRPFFPAERSRFLKAWISQPDSHALGITHGGKLAGYGVIRRCRSGCKIGPLYADSPGLAESLYHALKAWAEPTEAVYLDVPEVNGAAIELAERDRMDVSFETARMYTAAVPKLPLDRLFGVTSFEIG